MQSIIGIIFIIAAPSTQCTLRYDDTTTTAISYQEITLEFDDGLKGDVDVKREWKSSKHGSSRIVQGYEETEAKDANAVYQLFKQFVHEMDGILDLLSQPEYMQIIELVFDECDFTPFADRISA